MLIKIINNTKDGLTSRYQAIRTFFKSVFCQPKSELFDIDDSIEESVNLSLKSDVSLSKSTRIIFSIFFFVTIFIIWANLFDIDEVSKGDGKVIPSSKEQVIQSLDGGILTDLYVKEGEIVLPQQVLAQLDTTRVLSNVEESVAKYTAALASYSRINAEVNGIPLKFPVELNDYPDLIKAETILYNSRKAMYEESLLNISASKELISKELEINSRLAESGATSTVDILRLRKQLVELNMQEANLKSDYFVKSREEMSKILAEINSLAPIISGRQDLIAKSTIKSPVRGIVKGIEITTIGGVIAPNGLLMQIVPLDDSLLIEAKISPRDIAFIHPGQKAQVKITAYDYSIYGSLEGEVVMISPDTMKDEEKPDVVYYKVYIRTQQDHLENKNNTKFYITPGMIATVDIKTGQKTVAQYLMKPFNKINEALRER